MLVNSKIRATSCPGGSGRETPQEGSLAGLQCRPIVDCSLNWTRSARIPAISTWHAGCSCECQSFMQENEGSDMTRAYLAGVLVSAALVAGCQGGSTSESGQSSKLSGGVLRPLQPEPITIPEGSTFPLVLETGLSSATSRSGDLVVATFAEDFRVGQKVAVPAGSEVRGKVSAAVPSGRVKGDARLAFDFDTLVLKGKEHPIATRSVDITAANRHKRDALIIGGGAGAGGIVGGVVDGKKGAGIGALIGAATGTGVVLRNKGREVALGSGSRVTVRLTREARL